MIIALDIDETITRDYEFWLKFSMMFEKSKHKLYIVSQRNKSTLPRTLIELSNFYYDKIILTSGETKRKYLEDKNIFIDIWIDDNPASIENFKL